MAIPRYVFATVIASAPASPAARANSVMSVTLGDSFTISGFSGQGDGTLTQGATENIFSVSDAVSRIAGKHNIRFGVQAQYRKFQHLTEVPPRGSFTFNGTKGERIQVLVARDTARDAAHLARQMIREDIKAASVVWVTADE